MRRASTPPEGAGESMVADIIVCNTIVLSLASLGVFVRLLAQGWAHSFYAADAFCLISWVFAFVLCFTSMWMTRYGYGKHVANLEGHPDTFTMFLILDFVTAIAYLISLTAIKISFCLLYFKVFSVTHIRWLYYLVMAFVVCVFIEELFVFIFQCSPVGKLFHPNTVAGSCIDLYVFYYVSFAIRLITDIVLFLLPIPQLLGLKLRRGVKAGLLVMFGLGLLVCMTSIIRITYIRHFQPDYTWDLVKALNWSSVEVCVAILISCIPFFRLIIAKIFPFLRKTLGLFSGEDSRQHIEPHQTAQPEVDYFSVPVARRQSAGPPDCFPLPSPFVEEPFGFIFPVTGGAEPIVLENAR